MVVNTSSSTLSTTAPSPLPGSRLSEIAAEACEEALAGVTRYEHSKCEGWNGDIIQRILKRVVDEAPKNKHKYAINSTIVQHVAPNNPSSSTRTVGTSAGSSTSGNATSAAAVKKSDSEDDQDDDQDGGVTGRGRGGMADERISMGAVGGSALGAAGRFASTEANGLAASEQQQGRRGMHSATAGYWNLDKDGIWNFKYEAADERGLDVIICVLWITIA
ncbi:MAG: hypothetical protein M1815_002719 [Lichina confinis]|nr:MAG: hypothetical protein M1815_002719 [Lichina confinis]